MNNFNFITVEDFIKAHPDEAKNRDHLNQISKQRNSRCQCGQENVWRYGEADLCFTCTTGEADASDDYELI